MKRLLHLCAVAALTLTFAVSASADDCGEISCGVTNPPPPTKIIAGDMPNGPVVAADTVTETVLLTLMESMLALT